jgi:hypothetical protein
VPALRSLFLPLTLFLPVLLLIGCQEEGIETHRVPRVEIPEVKVPEAKVRLLGAIIPHENDTWFVKLVGPLEPVGAEVKAFDTFLGSLRFKDDPKEPISWTLPENWKTAEPKPLTFATIHISKPGDEKPLDVTITQLGKDGDARSLAKNVNRWRVKDLGLPAVGPVALPKLVTKKEIGADKEGKPVQATLVDMEGPGGSGMPPFANGDGPRAPDENAKLKYDTPKGWEAVSTKGRVIPTEAAFAVRDGERAAEVTITIAGGDLKTNVNRWRKQVGLADQSDAEMKKDLKTLTVAGDTAVYADLTAPGDEAGRKRILGVILNRKGTTWFFKMTGPADLVGKNKDAFEKFVGSVKFEGSNDG